MENEPTKTAPVVAPSTGKAAAADEAVEREYTFPKYGRTATGKTPAEAEAKITKDLNID